MFEYAPAPESRSVVEIAPSYGLFIDGEFNPGKDVFKTVNPATEEVLAEVALAGPEDVDRAVAAARRAFATWSALPGAERAKYLFRIARIIQERSRELAVLETLDNGKPIRESRDVDVPTGRRPLLLSTPDGPTNSSTPGFGVAPKPARRRRTDHPVELPAADGWPGRSRRRWRPETPSCSSRPRPPR